MILPETSEDINESLKLVLVDFVEWSYEKMGPLSNQCFCRRCNIHRRAAELIGVPLYFEETAEPVENEPNKMIIFSTVQPESEEVSVEYPSN